MLTPLLDQWAEWLLERRFGGDAEAQRTTLRRLAAVRDRVLDNAKVSAGETLLDVGCGDGLIGFAALDRVGRDGTVIFTDVSGDILEHDRALADRMAVAGRVAFHQLSADDLSAIPDVSVDVVTTRSVLAYVGPKRRAFAEFARVLRPGGRISLYEPINRLIANEPEHEFAGYDASPVKDLAQRINVAYTRRQPLERDPMFDFDERDLMAFATAAGFGERHLELRWDVAAATPLPWATFARTAANPLAPTLEEAMGETLAPDEIERFTSHLRPLVEQGAGSFATAVAYLWATLERGSSIGSA